jgi:Barrel-sandwich domain of CusB or HlyD membrane-fusion
MSQQQSVEAARVRIQRLVEEIAQLSKGDMRSEEFYQQFLTRAVQACDGKGGAVWIVGQRTADGKSEFQLAAAVELESSLFQTDENQRGALLRSLAEVVQTKKPLVLSAEGGGAAPGSLQSQLAQQPSPNKTPYPFVHVPLFLKEQVLGVLQVWLQPYVTRENYAEFATFLAQLASHVEQHFQSRRMGTMVVENQRLQHLLKFVSDMAGTLEPGEVARLATNYGRDLLGCERCSLLRFRAGSWEALSISGQEVVEKKSTMVKGIVAYVAAHTPHVPQEFTPEGATAPDFKPWTIVLSKKELLAIADSGATAAIVDESRSQYLRPHGPTDVADAAFFENSQVVSTLIVQLLDSDKHLVGALLAESMTEGFFDAPAGAKEASSHRLAEWMAGNAGRALKAALDHRELPFLFATKRLREFKRSITGTRRARYAIKRIIWLTLILGTLLFPWMREVESDCTLVPKKRVKVVPEINGRVEKVMTREGQQVKKGDPLARQETSALDAELAHTMQDMAAAVAEVQKFRGASDAANEQIAQTKVLAAEERIKRLKRDIEAATLRAPMDGVVMTKDIELYEGQFLSPGADFCVVGTTDAWDVQVHLNEKQIGKVEALLEKGPIDVQFILYSQNQGQLSGKFVEKNQLSQVAYPHERESAIRENAFILTLADVQAPDDVRRSFRPDLTGRASIKLGRTPVIVIWGKNIAEWIRLKWVW